MLDLDPTFHALAPGLFVIALLLHLALVADSLGYRFRAMDLAARWSTLFWSCLTSIAVIHHAGDWWSWLLLPTALAATWVTIRRGGSMPPTPHRQ
jgi:hypothetical protein